MSECALGVLAQAFRDVPHVAGHVPYARESLASSACFMPRNGGALSAVALYGCSTITSRSKKECAIELWKFHNCLLGSETLLAFEKRVSEVLCIDFVNWLHAFLSFPFLPWNREEGLKSSEGRFISMLQAGWQEWFVVLGLSCWSTVNMLCTWKTVSQFCECLLLW